MGTVWVLRQRSGCLVRCAAVGNRLYFGDNLDVLRSEIADESVDLIYLDPPLNSNRSDKVLFTFQATLDGQARARSAATRDIERGPLRTVLLPFMPTHVGNTVRPWASSIGSSRPRRQGSLSRHPTRASGTLPAPQV
jgi:hypothetical protein